MSIRYRDMLAAGTAICLVPHAAFANAGSAEVQPQPSVAPATDADGAIPDIIVTAQKRSERINDVPMSITAATGDQLANAGVTDASQLVKIVPGFTYQVSQYGTPVFGIRGISFFDTSGTAAPAVSVYVDQVPLPLSTLSRGAALDLERVEVLKGPQGTLFGENSTGGAINYIAAKPTDHFVAGADFTYGRFNQVEAGGYVSDALSDTLAIRLAARTERRGNWQRSTSRDDENGKRNFNVARFLVDWKPSSALRFELNINGWNDHSDTQAAQYISFKPSVPAPQGFPGAIAYLSAYNQRPDSPRAANWDPGFSLARRDRFFQTSLRGDWDVTDKATLTSITSYSHYKGDTPADVDGTDYTDVQNTLLDDFDIFSQELRLSLTTGPARWLVGGNYSHQKLDEIGANYLEGTNTLLAFPPAFFPYRTRFPLQVNLQKVDTYAIFGGVDWEVVPTLKFQGSIRYTKQERDGQLCSADSGVGDFATAFGALSSVLTGTTVVFNPGDCITLNAPSATNPAQSFLPARLIQRSLNDSNISWHAGLDWKPNRDVLVYAGATKGYKSGGFSTLPIGFTDQVTSVDQESVMAYEAGVKATLLGGRVQANASVFRYGYKNKQIAGFIPVPPFGTLPAVVNVPESRITGFELGLNAQPTSELKLSFSANYLDSKVTKPYRTFDPFGTIPYTVSTVPPVVAFQIETLGRRLPSAPRWQLSADAEYNFATTGYWQPFVGASMNYQSDSDAIFSGSSAFTLPSRTLIDLRAGAETQDGKWRIQLFGRNITNEYYWINVAHTLDTVAKYAGMPATYGVTVRFRFR